MLKKHWPMIVILVVVAIVIFVERQEEQTRAWYQHALWLNYDVDDLTFIHLERPDVAGPSAVVLLMGLPRACLQALDMDDWKPGTRGRLAFDKETCVVEPGLRWDPDEAAQHYRALTARRPSRNVRGI